MCLIPHLPSHLTNLTWYTKCACLGFHDSHQWLWSTVHNCSWRYHADVVTTPVYSSANHTYHVFLEKLSCVSIYGPQKVDLQEKFLPTDYASGLVIPHPNYLFCHVWYNISNKKKWFVNLLFTNWQLKPTYKVNSSERQKISNLSPSNNNLNLSQSVCNNMKTSSNWYSKWSVVLDIDTILYCVTHNL
jgi:hypothetical protein